MRPGIIALASGRSSGGGGGGGFADEILADSPTWFCRHNEASGTVAVNEVGADGTYAGAPILGAAAIYTGGLTCWDTNNNSYVDIPGSVLPSPATAITLEILLKRKATITGLQALIDRDPETSGREWQWRWENGDDLNWIKISGSVQTLLANDVGPANGVGLFGVVFQASGAVSILKNGAVVASGTQSPTDFGSAVALRIGRRVQGDSQGNYYCAESMVYPYAVPVARMLAHAQAAGLAPP